MSHVTSRRRKFILAFAEIISELLILCILHHLLDFDTIGVYRYLFVFLCLSLVLEGDHYSTELIWQESRKILQCNIVFFLVTLVMNPLKTITVEVVFKNALLCFCNAFFSIVIERTYRVVFYQYFAQKVLIFGTGEEAANLAKACRLNRFSLSKFVGFVNLNGLDNGDGVPLDLGNVVNTTEFNKGVVYDYDRLDKVFNELKPDMVFIAAPKASYRLMRQITDDIYGKVDTIKFLPQVNSLMTYDSEIQDFDGNLLIASKTNRIVFLDKICKRIIDLIAGIVGTLLVVTLSLYVKYRFINCGDHDSIFFRQRRIGKDGRTIVIYKFRTMVNGAEDLLKEILEKDPNARYEYEMTKKLKDDPRVTDAGKFLRKTSLDEFPQFINVLKGEMSLVGPRPYLPGEIKDMSRYYRSIVMVKPGITGMWQVSGRSDLIFKERCILDEYYVNNWSLWLDVTILIKTFKALFYREGAI